MRHACALAAVAGLGLGLPADGSTLQEPLRIADLADLDLEQLTRITVTSVSRRQERLADVPSSIYVITAEDIRRSGAMTLLEALRLAPNLAVLRSDPNTGSVGARGGLTGGVNKMLVLVDGRTVYSPLFSGVFWDAQDVMVEDIERIEVVSGPGSTLWGTNAVNGLIRVITRRARDTVGTYASVAGGNLDRLAEARSGARLGEAGALRLYGRAMERDARSLLSGASASDAERRWSTGFRYGSGSRAEGNAVTIQGDAYDVRADSATVTRKLSGGNLLARRIWALENGSSLTAQAYWDHYRRDQPGTLHETRDTFDVEVQDALAAKGNHRIVWGVNVRSSRDRTTPFPALGFVPGSRTLNTGSIFAQDDVQLSPAWRGTLGLRAERNPYTGWEWLPTARLSWQAAAESLLWAAYTRTVRAPTRVDRDAVAPGTPPFFLRPNDAFESEVANVGEIGYRHQLGARASFSVTAFQHDFRGLRTAQPVGGQVVAANGADATIRGAEGWVEALPLPQWRLTLGGTLMHATVRDRPGFVNVSTPPYGNNPERTFFLRSLWNVTRTVDLDVLGRYVSALPKPAVPAYATLDARVAWAVSKNVAISASVENLFDRKHVEFSPTSAVMERRWLIRLTWNS